MFRSCSSALLERSSDCGDSAVKALARAQEANERICAGYLIIYSPLTSHRLIIRFATLASVRPL
jgi:hypothetical protein